MNRSFTSVAVGSLIALIGSTANGAVVKVRVSAPTCNAPQVLTVRLLNHNGSSQVVPVVIDPVAHASPAAKAAAVVAALQNAGVSAQPLGVGEFQIDGGPNLKEASLEVGSTGEQSDVIKSPEPTRSTAAFQGAFEPFDPVGQPAIFTAGIVTDIGELTVRISAQELNFQTEGPVICQALFQRLAPRAPLYGALVNYAGDRLEVYSDPAYSITQGGVIFGTTSPSPGCYGSVDLPPPPSVILGVDTPTNTFSRSLDVFIVSPDGSVTVVPTLIDPALTTTAEQKRDRLCASMSGAGHALAPTGDPTKCGVNGVAPGTQVRMVDQGTGEKKDQLLVAEPAQGHAAFPGFFDPFDRAGQPAIFTAGVVTDVGELSVQISSQELNFQTEGPVICQALFQRLAPRAPQYGAQINYAGDRLEVYFDPAYSITMGGIVFGTTSLSPGAEGMVVIRPPIPITPGDMNCDGLVNGLDVDGFILAILSRNAYEAKYPGCNYLNGDMNSNGEVTVEDTDAFVARLAQ